MTKVDELEQYKKEFYEEIRNIDVKVADLRALKISDKVLASEVSLRRMFGDVIYSEKFAEIEDSENKTIEKLNMGDIEFDGTVREICERVIDNKFDAEVDMFLASGEEEG